MPDHADERKGTVGTSAGLQRHSTAHGPGRLQCRRRSTQLELQAHREVVDRSGLPQLEYYYRHRLLVHPHRSIEGSTSAGPRLASHAKTTT